MVEAKTSAAWATDGKFFSVGGRRLHVRAVSYGPFPGGWPPSFDEDFSQIAAAGFDALRLYEMPDSRLLDAAWRHGLRVCGGLLWRQYADFFRQPSHFSAARVELARALGAVAGHPAMVAVLVGNEIPADLVRWMGPLKVRSAIEELIDVGRELAPKWLFGYANYPSTEYLEPENADFSAFNIYLENPNDFRDYLRRLHHIAGDRPLMISEFGLDSRRNGLARQAEALEWALRIARDEACAGITWYAWSDRWWNHGREVTDWDFGLLDRNGCGKPALAAAIAANHQPCERRPTPHVSVIICTRNGRARIGRCLTAVGQLRGPSFEIMVVDDGSDDGLADFVEQHFTDVRVLRLPPSGLSAARNAGAAAAHGEILAFTDDDCEPDQEWLDRLLRVFADGRFVAVGGPNLPPPPQTMIEAVVCAAPGAPSHVMLDDVEAEHLPGCNLAVTRAAFEAIGGFDPQFHTAGDDVDFCWRLRDAGGRLGFSPGAFVWHWRRPSVRAFLRQQIGYGHAERLLIARHPNRFSENGDALWQGFVYGGGPVRVMHDSIIYHGLMGMAGYQSVINRMLPLRGISAKFDGWHTRLVLGFVKRMAPCLRAWARNRQLRMPRLFTDRHVTDFTTYGHEDKIPGMDRQQALKILLENDWQVVVDGGDWDLMKNGHRVLLATEHGRDGQKAVLIRIAGDRESLPWRALRAHHRAD